MVIKYMAEEDIRMLYHKDLGLNPLNSAMHQHNFDELVLVETGNSRIVTEKAVVRCSGSFVIFYPMGLLHTQFNDAAKPYTRYCVNYKPTFISDILPTELLPHAFFVLPLTSEETDRLKAYMIPLNEACLNGEDTPTEIYRRKLLLGLILNELAPLVKARLSESDPAKQSGGQMADICMYISKHFDEPLTLDGIAKHFFISRSKLVRSFRSSLDTTVHDYITQVRIGHSKGLLRQGAAVQEVARQCGFADVGYYIKVFRKTVGMTPVKYRKLYKESS